uniref:ethanolamine kinase 1-like n=1 Tax=Styela clava TaxID=7725 RepID=UPI0019393677|nr:ethanolamine kinase 1-like [Styela clava]
MALSSEQYVEPLKIDLTLDMEDYEKGVDRILHLVRPNWSKENITMKVFSNGITNKMLGFTHKENKSDIVLIRINGNKTEIFLDRDAEVKSFKTLHKAGCAPNLYCIFSNGLCYEYIPGNTVSREQVRDPKIYRLIAKEMARLHKIQPEIDCNGNSPAVFRYCNKFLHLSFSENSPPGRSLNGYTGPLEKELHEELNMLEEHLSKLGSQLVYCHNDLLLNNIIYNDEKNSVHFIDFEYTGMNFQAYDIANHFCEFAGVDDADFSFYPDYNLQIDWIKEYLKHWNKGTEPSDHDIKRLYVQVNKFALAAHFLWGTWSLTQAKYSSIEFDYLGYAQQRLDEYQKRKEEFLALKMP